MNPPNQPHRSSIPEKRLAPAYVSQGNNNNNANNTSSSSSCQFLKPLSYAFFNSRNQLDAIPRNNLHLIPPTFVILPFSCRNSNSIFSSSSSSSSSSASASIDIKANAEQLYFKLQDKLGAAKIQHYMKIIQKSQQRRQQSCDNDEQEEEENIGGNVNKSSMIITSRLDSRLNQIEDFIKANTVPQSGGLVVICDSPTLQMFKNSVISALDHAKDPASIEFHLVCLKFVETIRSIKQDAELNNKRHPRLVCVNSAWLEQNCVSVPIPRHYLSLFDDPNFFIPEPILNDPKIKTYLYFHLEKIVGSSSSSGFNANSNNKNNNNNNNRSFLSRQNSDNSSNSQSQSQKNNDSRNSNNNNQDEEYSLNPFLPKNKVNPFERQNSDDQNSNNNSSAENRNQTVPANNNNQRNNSQISVNTNNDDNPTTTTLFKGIFGDSENFYKEVVEDAVKENNNNNNSNNNEPEARNPYTNFVNDGLTSEERTTNQQKQLTHFQRKVLYNQNTDSNNNNNNSRVDNNNNNNQDSQDNNNNNNTKNQTTKVNQGIIDHLYALAELQNAHRTRPQDAFRVMAYKKAAYQIRCLPFKISGSRDIPQAFRKGIGQGISDLIDEYFLCGGTTRKFHSFAANPEILAKQELVKIWGVGAATAAILVRDFHIRSVEDLRYNKEAQKILTENQLLGLEHFEDLKERIPRAEIEILQSIVAKNLARDGFDTTVESSGIALKSSRDVSGLSASSAAASLARESVFDPETGKMIQTRGKIDLVTCGSFRRGHLQSGDVDILMCVDREIMSVFLSIVIKHFQKQADKNSEVDNRFNSTQQQQQRYRPPLPEEFCLFKKLIDSGRGQTTQIKLSESWMGIVQAQRCADPSRCPCAHKPDGSHFVRRLDLKAYTPAHFAFAKLYFTGSAFFNRAMRWYAQKIGFRLSDVSLIPRRMVNGREIFTGNEIPCKTEKDVFTALGLKEYLEPSQRDVTGKGFRY